MTEFDRIVFLERLVGLYAERGEELSQQAVMRRAEVLAKKRGIELCQALERMERGMLNHNPNPEKWE